MNQALFDFINQQAGHWSTLDWLGIFAAESLLFVMVIAVLLLALNRRTYAKSLLLTTTASGILAGLIISPLLKVYFAHPRPYVALADSAHLLVNPDISESLQSFPSGHTIAAFAIAVSVFLISRKWGALFLAAAFLVGIGRIYIGVHWPLDVLGGIVLGVIIATACHMAVKYGRRYLPKPKPKAQSSE